MAALLVCTNTAAAQPVRQPSWDEIRLIQTKIDEANNASKKYQAARGRKTEIEEKLLGGLDRALTEEEIARLPLEKRGAYRQAVSEYSIQRQRAVQIYNEAIGLTLKYYQIEPMQTSGRVPDRTGLDINWNPRFSDRQEPNQEPESVQYGFIRPSDGTVVLRDAAFSSPGFLALVLQHESFHFDIWLTEGARTSSTREAEIRLQKALLPDARSVYKVTDMEFRYLVAMAAMEQWLDIEHRRGNRQPNLNPAWLRGILNGTNPVKGIDFGKATEPLASVAKSEPILFSKALEQVYKSFVTAIEMAQLGQKRLARLEAERVRREKRQEKEYRAWLEQRERARIAAWKYLEETVELACSSPDEFEKRAISGELVGVGIEPLDFLMFLRSMSSSRDLNQCQKDMMYNLSKARRQIAAKTLAGWAREWRIKNPTFVESIERTFQSIGGTFSEQLKSVGKTMNEFLEALSEAHDSRPSSGSSSDGWERYEGWPRSGGQRINPQDMDSLRDLNSVNMKGWGTN